MEHEQPNNPYTHWGTAAKVRYMRPLGTSLGPMYCTCVSMSIMNQPIGRCEQICGGRFVERGAGHPRVARARARPLHPCGVRSTARPPWPALARGVSSRSRPARPLTHPRSLTDGRTRPPYLWGTGRECCPRRSVVYLHGLRLAVVCVRSGPLVTSTCRPTLAVPGIILCLWVWVC